MPPIQEAIDLSLPHQEVPAANLLLDFITDGSADRLDYSRCADEAVFATYVSRTNQQWRREGFLRRFGLAGARELAGLAAEGGALADLGCGPGLMLPWLAELYPDRRVLGLDYSEMLLAFDRHFGPVQGLALLRCDLNRPLPLLDACLGLAVCDYVLNDLPDPAALLAEAARALRPGGWLAVSLSLEQAPLRRISDQWLADAKHEAGEREAADMARQLTDLARDLAASPGVVRLERDYPLLGMQRGEHPIQAFVYHFFLKCFWNGDPDFSLSKNLTNLRFQRPLHMFSPRQAEDLLRPDFEIVHRHNDRSTLSLLARRRGEA